MSLTTSTITGRIPLPNNAASGSMEIIFTLNATDTEGVNVIPAESSVRYQMTPAGEFPEGAALWRNTEGLRGTSYRVEAQWVEIESGRPVTKDVLLGYVQVGDEASYSIGDLLASPSTSELGWYVNVPQSTWDDFNARLDYMYSIAESSLPATVERAVEAELAAAQSALEAQQSAQAAAGSADQAVIDVQAARDDALLDITTSSSTAVGAVETARDDALDQINPKVQQAETAAQTATTQAGNAATSAGNAATSAGAAATSAGNAATSETNAATSASNAYGSELSASSSAASAAGALANVEAASTAAAISAQEALDSEIAARSSEVSAAGSASAAASSASTASGAAAAALNSASAAALSAGSANDAYVATQDLMDQFANFRFLGKVEWWPGNPAMIPAGFLPLNGQLLNRADYPDLWEDISNGVFVSVTEATWQSDAGARGRFSLGDGTTTFRMPDLNGAQSGSRNGAFLRGAKNPETYGAGAILGDAIRNITGEFGMPTYSTTTMYEAASASGAFFGKNLTNQYRQSTAAQTGATSQYPKNYGFDASRQVPTSTEVRPVSAVGTWIMLVNGAPARQFNPETSAGLGSNTFGGLQKFNAGFEWVGVVPQLIQTDVDQGLTVAQKLVAATNAGAVSYASPQSLTSADRVQALKNVGGIPYLDDLSTVITAAQKAIARKNIGLGTPAEVSVAGQLIAATSFGEGIAFDFRTANSSGTEVWRCISSSLVHLAGSSADQVVSYGMTFVSSSHPVVTNGDATAMPSLMLSTWNRTNSGFAVTARQFDGSPFTGAYRINYTVWGRIA